MPLRLAAAARVVVDRRACALVAGILSVSLLALTARAFASGGLPLPRLDVRFAAAGAALVLVGQLCKVVGWSRLFSRHQRPGTCALALASGAAALSGLALPGRVEDGVRIAVIRRHPGCRADISTLALSLVALGMVECAALMPLASTAAATSDRPLLRIALAVVAAAGLGAAVVLLILGRVLGAERLRRFRLAAWLAQRVVAPKNAVRALPFVAAGWLARMGALVTLLAAAGLGPSIPLALAFMCGSAACGVLPVAPAGAATQAGAGAAVLVASGVAAPHAIAFALAVQALGLIVSASVFTGALGWHGARFAARRLALR